MLSSNEAPKELSGRYNILIFVDGNILCYAKMIEDKNKLLKIKKYDFGKYIDPFSPLDSLKLFITELYFWKPNMSFGNEKVGLLSFF